MIKKHNPIEQVASRLGIHIDRDGRCACPLHQGKGRNFSINKRKGIWHCFVCNKGGDVITLVQELKHCSYAEACEWLGGDAMDDKAIARYEAESLSRRLSFARGRRSFVLLSEVRRYCYDWCKLLVRIPISSVSVDRLWNNPAFCWSLNHIGFIDYLLDLDFRELDNCRKEVETLYGEYRAIRE